MDKDVKISVRTGKMSHRVMKRTLQKVAAEYCERRLHPWKYRDVPREDADKSRKAPPSSNEGRRMLGTIIWNFRNRPLNLDYTSPFYKVFWINVVHCINCSAINLHTKNFSQKTYKSSRFTMSINTFSWEWDPQK